MEFKFPDIGEGITEGTIVRWLVKVGDKVSADQPVAEIETDKAVVEIPSPKAGTILKIHVQEGGIIKVGSALITLGEEGEKIQETTSSQPAKPEKPASVEKPKEGPKVESLQELPLGKVLAAPSTRRLARELNVDITKVTGTGSGGKITDDDVRTFSKTGASQVVPSRQEIPTQKPLPVTINKDEGEVEMVPLSHMRKVIGENISRSAFTIPQVTHMDEVDITELSVVREREKISMEGKGVKLTYLPFIIKAVVSAIREYPKFNSVLDLEKSQLFLKKYCNMGIAVDTPEGLMVFVIKNAHKKSIVEIAQELQKLSEEARNRKIALSDLKGGTFTITNIGSIGGIYATPIINPPEVAILGLGRIRERLTMLNNQMQNRKILYLSLTFDHRVIDGAEAARFTNVIIKHLEDPNLMLVEAI